MLILGVPVDPDAATARRRLREELLDPIYHEQRSLLQRALDWLAEQLDGLPALGMSGQTGLLVVLGVVVVVLLVALRVAGPVRRSRRRTTALRHADDRRTADQLRRAADAAASAGDWSTAVAERYRAVVRALEERTVLDERPGRTAHEAARTAGRALPAHADALAAAGGRFDDVVYGERPATAQDDDALRALDAALAAARPVGVGA